MFTAILITATLLCGLVAGLLFAFAVVAMPGIATLSDREYLRAFRGMDGIIQNNQPLFMLAWAGSVVSLIAAAIAAFVQAIGPVQWIVAAAAAVYVLGVQVPTAVVNIPLNNHLQRVDIDDLSDADSASERRRFEQRWNQWNRFRAVMSVMATTLLLVALVRL